MDPANLSLAAELVPLVYIKYVGCYGRACCAFDSYMCFALTTAVKGRRS